jgi:hypothetical protein
LLINFGNNNVITCTGEHCPMDLSFAVVRVLVVQF